MISRIVIVAALGLAGLLALAASAPAQPAANAAQPAAAAAQPAANAAQPAANAERVAVLDLEPVQASPAQARAISERLRQVLQQGGRVTLVQAGRMGGSGGAAPGGHGCASQDCAVRMGRQLGVAKLVLGRVVKLSEGSWLLSAAVLDVNSAQMLKVASVSHQGDYQSLLDGEVAGLGNQLFAPPPGSAAAAATPPDASKAPRRAGAAPAGNKVALFALYFSGPRSSTMEVRAPLFANAARDQFSGGKEPVQLVYAHGEEPSARSALDQEIADETWSGLFSKSPNEDFIYRKGAELGADYVLVIAIQTVQKGRGKEDIYIFDVASRSRFVEHNDWFDEGTAHIGTAQRAGKMLERLRFRN
jgi:hypothetical protein